MTHCERPLRLFLSRRIARSGLRLCVLACMGIVPLTLASCSKISVSDITGSVRKPSMPTDEGELRRYSEELGQRYDRNRQNKATAIEYAQVLRKLGQNAQAQAVMEALAIRYPNDQEVLGEFGKALSDNGQLQRAAEVLKNAHTPERPNWKILSAQGAVADKLGDHQEAQAYYEAALKIQPNDPGVLSNLGLSYALSRNLKQAESSLRLAVAQPGADGRERQNLALVLALQGKFSEAEQVARIDLPPMQAAANVASIRAMIAQSNTWRDIQQIDHDGAPAPKGKKGKKGKEQKNGPEPEIPAALDAPPNPDQKG